MNTYRIKIVETNVCYVDVEALNEDDALKMVEDDYWGCSNDYCLEPEDTNFELV